MQKKTSPLNVFCVNNGAIYSEQMGATLKEISEKEGLTYIKDEKTGMEYPVLAALVDHSLKELSYEVNVPCEVEFVGYNHADGRRTYIRSLCFVLQKAVSELYPDKVLLVDHSLPSGLYCEIIEKVKREDGSNEVYFTTDEEVEKIRARMHKIISEDIPFVKEKILSSEAVNLFTKQNQPMKAALVKSIGKYSFSVYHLGGQTDTFYGPLLPSSGYLTVFDLMCFNNGFCLQSPSLTDFHKVSPMRRQSKIAAALKAHSDWCSMIGINGVGSLNETIQSGKAVEIINLAEARHERKYAEIADQIYQRRGQVKIVFIAGPSSSGKTSSSLRLAIQCKVLGLNPKVIELDNYFLDRERTPRDENGEYDFESLHAMDLEFLNRQLNDLLAGKEVEIPKFDFKDGHRIFNGNFMRLEEKDILIMEGIHALNPEMVPSVDNSRIFRVYASALTSLNIDENNNISTSDNRMLRRMVRDNRTRHITPEETIERWHSVRRGESRNIFPFQEHADALFNSALIFELPLLKYYAEPLLLRITPSSPAYNEAVRILKFLSYIVALSPDEIAAIPPTSIMREFIGGQTL